ncbi:hypothetical protein [Bifidobacterium pseudolongum]|uniref:hypothetical protein n=1 Tax=Bifidobacterium pseudolongum TaxID=1694 RepID=UPI001F5CD29D|nr:hypothetical protein [Bifidobacterium pseudolongum]
MQIADRVHCEEPSLGFSTDSTNVVHVAKQFAERNASLDLRVRTRPYATHDPVAGELTRTPRGLHHKEIKWYPVRIEIRLPITDIDSLNNLFLSYSFIFMSYRRVTTTNAS